MAKTPGFVVKNVDCFVHLFCPCEHVYTNGLLPKEIRVHPPFQKNPPNPYSPYHIDIRVIENLTNANV